ncbi:uncharacterized protein Z518_00297 [Rhinocladiella mackenziei CBS 650.93]|uniref:PhoD-like phosphatase metallophosphatase domain-containing protein n=1 Tax=Rhinocladiella mackenziei CBS 650.93 TaxID=1442369 RepID=A0A0D2HEW4_9EURO|nr:uncharacterized protein Z518_00297 [Rhinocladiella mackenziei CBS 650.93]KIX09218.1 hypothetical protein Z518_00297 [Rhinocladiella mackenziei CBS 650.93]
MPPILEIITGTSSIISRLAAFIFLRWIPSHIFPPIIVTAVAIYLSCILAWPMSDSAGMQESNHEAIPPPDPNGIPAEHLTPDDHQEPILYDDEKSTFKILLLGIPDWREKRWSYMTIGVNILLALFTLDLAFRGPLFHPAQDLSFTRVGYVSSDSAKVLIREPDPAQLPMYVYLSMADKTKWTTTDTIYYLGPETDYTYAANFHGLRASTKYIYSLSNDKQGTFITAPSPYSEAANSLTFLTSSCMKANFPYRPWAHALSIRGFEYLSKVVRSLPSPASFMLFLGDFIYIDVPMRLSSSLQHYRSEYRRVYASPSWSLPGLDSLPWIHTLDDHEIANDWSAGNDTDPFPAASDPFIHYHVSINPPVPLGSPSGLEANITYFQFSNGPASFFMLDTRRYRTDPEPPSAQSSNTPSNYTILGTAQLASLLKYLSTPEPGYVHWKIIATSVPFTKNWRFGTSDTWGGFLHERAKILAAMHAAERDLGVRVIVLSGDRHEFAAIRFPPPVVDFAASKAKAKAKATDQNATDQTHSNTDTKTVFYDRNPQSGPHEFSVGPFSMFYLPFRTFKQIDDEDVTIKYIPDGNNKIGVVEIQNLAGEVQRSLLKYSLYIDGALAWEYALTSPANGSGKRGWAWALGGGRRRWLWN